jgi:hypothetical protein
MFGMTLTMESSRTGLPSIVAYLWVLRTCLRHGVGGHSILAGRVWALWALLAVALSVVA